MLFEIPKNLVNMIKSQQYIHSTYTIVKELVENSLDSGADTIKICLTSSCITVDDNGSGIDDLDRVCIQGYTSKEKNTYKVLGVKNSTTSFYHGFRGQALSSINELCDVEIITKTREKIISNELNANSSSTLGYLKNFVSGEVKRFAREPGTTIKVTNLFKSCAIRRKINEKSKRKNIAQIITLLQSFCYVNRVNFLLYDNEKILLNCKGSGCVKNHSIEKHGNIYLEINDAKLFLLIFPNAKDQTKIMIYEKRIVYNSRIDSIISTSFKKYINYNPTFVLILKDESDINLSNDKTEVVIKGIKYIENTIKSEIDKYFSTEIYIKSNTKLGTNLCSKTLFTDLSKDIHSLSEVVKNDKLLIQLGANLNSPQISCSTIILNNASENIIGKKIDENAENYANSKFNVPNININDKISGPISLNIFENSMNIGKNIDNFVRDEVYKNSNLNALGAFNCEENKNNRRIFPWKALSIIKEEVLSYPDCIINKEDFKKLEIIGQFNQGFIICTLIKNDFTFLLAIDQHAADEIYNFEKLQKSFVLRKQTLIYPIDVELSPIQELLLDEHSKEFHKNGFTVKNKKIYTLPVYKNITFDIEDFYSLLENVSNEIYESNKFRDIMASKACRSSIMIGKSLCFREMRKVLDNLSSLNFPWRCPHGRPTFQIITRL